jgi:hypothetical protein
MANRPIFIYTGDLHTPVIEKNIEFEWIKGTSFIQKQKRVIKFHEAAKKIFKGEILEVSSKSDKELGIRLSAFNLKMRERTVEEIYQNSKVYDKNNNIISFNMFGKIYPNNPKNLFYDWIYISALKEHQEYYEELNNYEIFTDIEFNPNKSFNCQARAVAVFKTLYINNKITDLTSDFNEFLKYYKTVFVNNEQTKMFL